MKCEVPECRETATDVICPPGIDAMTLPVERYVCVECADHLHVLANWSIIVSTVG